MRVRTETVRVLAAIGAAILTLALMPASARAQNVPLAQLLPDLILREIIVQSGVPAGVFVFSHEAHFSPLTNELNNPVVGIVQSFNTQMATQFSTFPLGSSTGGLTYVFDESVGTFRRGSTSFGPLFAERALTIGRRKLSAGFNYQRTSYGRFEGQNLDDGSIKFYLRHQDCCTVVEGGQDLQTSLRPNGTRFNPPFEGDLIEAVLSLKATTHTTAVFANYGVTDRWDIGLAVPLVRVNLDASVRARILRLATGPPIEELRKAGVPDSVLTDEQARRAALNVHTFEVDNPDATRTVQHFGHASGLGDIVLRNKYHFLRMAGGGLAAAVDLRLPTGDENELLGAGGVQAKFLLVASSERGRFGQHVNLGYTAAEGEVAGTLAGLISAPLPDEINYSAGIEFVASPRLTLMGDVVGRTLRGAGRLDLVSKNFEYVDTAKVVAQNPRVPIPRFHLPQVDFSRRVQSPIGRPHAAARYWRGEVQPHGQPAHLGQRAVPPHQRRPSKPPHNSDWRGLRLLKRQQYVITPDGQRFLMRTLAEDVSTSPITVILNWKPKP